MNPKDAGDVLAGGGAIGAFTGYLPEIAAFLAIIWTLIRIYEWARIRIFNKPKSDGEKFE